MLIVKSLTTGLLLLVLLLSPAMHFLLYADAAVLYGSNTTAEARDLSNSSREAYLSYQAALLDVRAGVTTSRASHEWTMQCATARNLSQGSAVVSSNATRIVVPVAGAQNSPGVDSSPAMGPALPAWLWALVPIAIAVVLAAFFILRTIFEEEDDERAASKTTDSDSGEGVSEAHDKKPDAHLIPIKGPDEPQSVVGARRDSKGRITRIRIDDEEPNDYVSDDTKRL